MSSLILAIDTATPAVTAGVVRRDGDAIEVLARRVTVDARAHAELLTPHVLGASRAGLTPPISTPSSSAPDRGRSPVCGWGWPPPPRSVTPSVFRSTACAASTPSGCRTAGTCWWSPMPAGARCTGRATRDGRASRALRCAVPADGTGAGRGAGAAARRPFDLPVLRYAPSPGLVCGACAAGAPVSASAGRHPARRSGWRRQDDRSSRQADAADADRCAELERSCSRVTTRGAQQAFRSELAGATHPLLRGA